MKSSSDRFTLVTGAASGIGRGVVEHLVGQSKHVVAFDKNGAGIKELQGLHSPERLTCCEVDLLHQDEIDAQLKARFDLGHQIEGLAHCAGVWAGGSILETSAQSWTHLIQNNLIAARNICTRVAPAMIQAKTGAMVIVSSNAGRLPRLDMSAYCVTKAALRMYAQCLALELAPHQVRCNIVSPGATQTPMQASYQAYLAKEKPSTRFRIPAPLEGASTPQDIAHLIAFLLSPAANSITMADISADRGATLGV